MPRFSPTRLLAPLLLLSLLQPAGRALAGDTAGADLSGKYALAGASHDDKTYSGTVTIKKKGTWNLPTGQLADLYQMEWLYPSGNKDKGLGVYMDDVLYMAWCETEHVELYIAMPSPFSEAQRANMAADYDQKLAKATGHGEHSYTRVVDKSLFPGMKAGHNMIAYGFRRDGIVKLISLGGPEAPYVGDFTFEGISLNQDGKRDGQFHYYGMMSIADGEPGLVVTGSGRNYLPEVNDYQIEGAALPMKADGTFIFSSAGTGWDPNGVGAYVLEGKVLKGQLYDRETTSINTETLTPQ